MPKRPKGLNMSITYVNNILQNLFKTDYAGLRIVVSYSAMQELFNEGKSIDDVVEILEEGQDAPRKRSSDTIERWLNKGSKTFNAVIVKDYNCELHEDCWVLIHFGRFTRK